MGAVAMERAGVETAAVAKVAPKEAAVAVEAETAAETAIHSSKSKSRRSCRRMNGGRCCECRQSGSSGRARHR